MHARTATTGPQRAGSRAWPADGASAGSLGAPGSGQGSVTMRLRGGPEAASAARRALGRLRDDLEPPVIENLQLLVTELVTNSVRHADSGHIALHALVSGGLVWTEVCDEGPGFEPRPRRDGQADDSGWGLYLVEELADDWGVERESGRTRVWFQLAGAA